MWVFATRCSVRHPYWTLVLVLLVTAGLAGGAAQARFADIDDLFVPNDLPQEATRERVQTLYGTPTPVFVLFESSTPSSVATVRAVHAVERDLRAVAVVEGTVSLAGAIEAQTGAQLAALDDDQVRKAIAALRQGPGGMSRWVSGPSHLLVVEVDPEADDADVVEALDAALAPHRDTTDAGLQVAGQPYVNQAQRAGGVQDLRYLMPLAMGFILVSLLLFFRRGSDAVLPLVTVLVATAWAYMALPLVDVPFSPLLFSVGPLVVGIGVDYLLHMLYGYDEARRPGQGGRLVPPAEALVSTSRHIGTPVFFTMVTTSIGFGSFLLSDIPQVRHWGILIAFGAIAAFVLSVTLFPALYALRDRGDDRMAALKAKRRARRRAGQGPGRFVRATDRMGRSLLGRPYTVLGVFAVVAALCVVGASQVRLSTEVGSSTGAPTEAEAAFDLVEQRFGGGRVMYLLIERPASEMRVELDRFTEAVGALDGVSFVDSPTARARLAHNGTLPGSSGYEAALDGAAGELSKDGTTLVVARYNTTQEDQVVDNLTALAAESPLQPELTGRGLVDDLARELILEGLMRSTGAALVAVLAVLAIVLRNLRATLVAFLPLLVTILVQFGIQGFAGISLNPVTGVTTAMVIGVGVDYSLHFVARMEADRKGGATRHQAALAAVREVGRPVIAGTVTTMGAFVILAFSQNAQVHQFGIVAAIVIAAAFLVSVTLCPVLYAARDKPQERISEPPRIWPGQGEREVASWRTAKLRCPHCHTRFTFSLKGARSRSIIAPFQLCCPHCAQTSPVRLDQVGFYEDTTMPRPGRGRETLCTACDARWSVGPLQPGVSQAGRDHACPNCGRRDRIARVQYGRVKDQGRKTRSA